MRFRGTASCYIRGIPVRSFGRPEDGDCYHSRKYWDEWIKGEFPFTFAVESKAHCHLSKCNDRVILQAICMTTLFGKQEYWTGFPARDAIGIIR